jgi:hypothetical protein
MLWAIVPCAETSVGAGLAGGRVTLGKGGVETAVLATLLTADIEVPFVEDGFLPYIRYFGNLP